MKKLLIALFVLLSVSSSFAQYNLNDYKYVIVPKRFGFQDEANQYRLNMLTKFMLKKYGFKAYLDNEIFPDDLAQNPCLALKADVESKGTFTTKTIVKLYDCKNQLVYQTKEAKSKEKEYSKVYNLTIRDAMTSLAAVNYTYVPNDKYKTNSTTEAKEIQKLKAEIKELKESKKPSKEVLQQRQDDMQKVEKTTALIDNKSFTVKQIFNGYRLLDVKGNEAMIIFDSGLKDVFIVKGKDAVIYKKEDVWIYSETNETNLLTEIINIKF